MKIYGITFLHFLLLRQTALTEQAVSVIAELGTPVLLPCLDLPVNKTATVTYWYKDKVALAHRNHSLHDTGTHISILDNSSLSIGKLMKIDEARYKCVTEPPSSTHQEIQLQVTEGPKHMVVNIQTATSLSNGTLFVLKGSTVTFDCSSTSYPSQNLTWTYEDTAQDVKENKSRAFGNKTSLYFEIINIQPVHQTNYTCLAQNVVSEKTAARGIELLVYYAPEIHPNCIWHDGAQINQTLFNCSWSGAYPTPTLTVLLDSQGDRTPKLNRSQETENFELTLNRSMMYDGQNITCVGKHIAQKPGDMKNCTFTLAAPYPMGQPMVAALEGTNITLTCTESKSLPPARTEWQRGVKQEPVVPSSKYVVVKEGPNLSLTIINATKDDQGVYFCWSENVLAAKELEVYLTIRSSADKSGAMVGVFISFFILAAGVTVGYFAYTHRDRICLGFRFGRLKDDHMDVINLMESDEEEVLNNPIPRLPPLTNGDVSAPATTLVEIHRIHSNDHDDNVNDTNLDHHAQDHKEPD